MNARVIHRQGLRRYRSRVGRAFVEVSYPLTCIPEPLPSAFNPPGWKPVYRGAWEIDVQDEDNCTAISITKRGGSSVKIQNGHRVGIPEVLPEDTVQGYLKRASWEDRWLYWTEEQERPMFLSCLSGRVMFCAKSVWPRIAEGRVWVGYSVQRPYLKMFSAALHQAFRIARQAGVDLRLRKIGK